MMREVVLKLRMLTVELAGDSESMIMAGHELTIADSSGDLTKGMMKFARYRRT
jgi:hypothetical protein